MRYRFAAVLISGAALCWNVEASPCRANDSSAELGVGGLIFTKNEAVSVVSEDLFISIDRVVVRYVFLNQGANPVTLTVAFPLPDLELADAESLAIPTSDPLNYVGFSTKIDGKRVSFTIDQHAVLNGKDVTADLRALGVPALPIGVQQLKVSDLPEKTRERAVAEGLLVQAGTNDKGLPLYEPTWTLKTSVVRQQTFPPGKRVSVEHRYRTSIGRSQDSVLRRGPRQSAALGPEVESYKTKFCIGDDFLKAVDSLSGISGNGRIAERRISYVLKTGANWAGPIKNFRLVVDKGQASRIVSFCGGAVKKLSATAVEMRAVDFTPTQDLNIIILGRK
jgi:hypothetical protein